MCSVVELSVYRLISSCALLCKVMAIIYLSWRFYFSFTATKNRNRLMLKPIHNRAAKGTGEKIFYCCLPICWYISVPRLYKWYSQSIFWHVIGWLDKAFGVGFQLFRDLNLETIKLSMFFMCKLHVIVIITWVKSCQPSLPSAITSMINLARMLLCMI